MGLFPGSYGDPLTFWSRTADQLDGYLDTAQEFYGGYDPWIGWSPLNPTQPITFFGVLHGKVNSLRVGSGTGQALYCEDNVYGKAAFIAMDIVRASGIFATLAGSFAGRVGGPSVVTRGKTVFIGKLDDLRNVPANQTLLPELTPGLGSARANFQRNSSVLRQKLREGFTIQDVSFRRLNTDLDPTILRTDRTVGQSFLGQRD